MKGFRKLIALVAIAACSLLVSSHEALAQLSPEASDSISVTAENEGVFTFAIAQANFDFGVVDADGETSSTGVAGSNGASGATYTKSNASAFSVTSAPVRTVRIFNASSSSTIGWGSADRLEIQIPTTGLSAGSSCAFKTFSTAGDGGAGDCDLGNLYHTLSVGNDAADENGQVDLRLTVANADGTGNNSWTVNLTASAL